MPSDRPLRWNSILFESLGSSTPCDEPTHSVTVSTNIFNARNMFTIPTLVPNWPSSRVALWNGMRFFRASYQFKISKACAMPNMDWRNSMRAFETWDLPLSLAHGLITTAFVCSQLYVRLNWNRKLCCEKWQITGNNNSRSPPPKYWIFHFPYTIAVYENAGSSVAVGF